VKAATGEVVTAQELGGADVHTRLSGVADHLADDDQHAIEITRDIVANLNRVKNRPFSDLAQSEEPAYSVEDIYGVIPADTRKPFDVREIIARIVDGSRLHEFKPLYGDTVVCGFGHIYGMPIGIVANNGVLFQRKRT
jgi:3-methylcrotonyl-CoA carboxylase beta subunit